MNNRIFVLILLTIMMCVSMESYSQTDLPTRDKIADKYKWNLSDIYKNESEWTKEYDNIQKDINSLKDYKGKISTRGSELLSFLNKTNEIEARLNKLYIYASLGKDIDLNDESYKSMFDRSQSLLSKYSSATSFFVPELMTISDEVMAGFYKSEIGLESFRQKLSSIFLVRKNTLSEPEEKLLAELMPVFVIPSNTYNTLIDAELPFPKF